jgi:hypothetical protein
MIASYGSRTYIMAIMAILAAAVPDEIGVIPVNERLSGIMVTVRG